MWLLSHADYGSVSLNAESALCRCCCNEALVSYHLIHMAKMQYESHSSRLKAFSSEKVSEVLLTRLFCFLIACLVWRKDKNTDGWRKKLPFRCLTCRSLNAPLSAQTWRNANIAEVDPRSALQSECRIKPVHLFRNREYTSVLLIKTFNKKAEFSSLFIILMKVLNIVSA